MIQDQYDLLFKLLIEGSTSLYLKGEKMMLSAPASICIALTETLGPEEREKLRATMKAASDAALSKYRGEV